MRAVINKETASTYVNGKRDSLVIFVVAEYPCFCLVSNMMADHLVPPQKWSGLV